MTIEKYLRTNDVLAFCARATVSRGHIANIISGRRSPSLDLVKKIHDATNGAVTWRDWGRQYSVRVRG